MKRKQWLEATAWFGLAIMVLASIISSDFIPYLSQIAFLIYVLLSAKGKVGGKIFIVVVSAFLVLIRLVTYESLYDLIDISLWLMVINFVR